MNQEEIEHITQSHPQPEQNITNAHFPKKQLVQEVLLVTAQVEIKARYGNTYILRALIDLGS